MVSILIKCIRCEIGGGVIEKFDISYHRTLQVK